MTNIWLVTYTIWTVVSFLCLLGLSLWTPIIPARFFKDEAEHIPEIRNDFWKEKYHKLAVIAILVLYFLIELTFRALRPF